MISSLKPQVPTQTARMQAGAAKLFEEAGGDTAALVPGLEDSYEDLAADFLEGWLTAKPSFEEAKPAQQDVVAPQTVEQPKPQAEAVVAAEPKFTSFNLSSEWNIA